MHWGKLKVGVSVVSGCWCWLKLGWGDRAEGHKTLSVRLSNHLGATIGYILRIASNLTETLFTYIAHCIGMSPGIAKQNKVEILNLVYS